MVFVYFGNKKIKMSSINKPSKKKSTSLGEFNEEKLFSFSKKNYKILLFGLAINILGFILMIGGGSDDPNQFDASELFSHRRITISPILLVIGYIIIAYAIMKKEKVNSK